MMARYICEGCSKEWGPCGLNTGRVGLSQKMLDRLNGICDDAEWREAGECETIYFTHIGAGSVPRSGDEKGRA